MYYNLYYYASTPLTLVHVVKEIERLSFCKSGHRSKSHKPNNNLKQPYSFIYTPLFAHSWLLYCHPSLYFVIVNTGGKKWLPLNLPLGQRRIGRIIDLGKVDKLSCPCTLVFPVLHSTCVSKYTWLSTYPLRSIVLHCLRADLDLFPIVTVRVDSQNVLNSFGFNIVKALRFLTLIRFRLLFDTEDETVDCPRLFGKMYR